MTSHQLTKKIERVIRKATEACKEAARVFTFTEINNGIDSVKSVL
ncbi:hypothetical protein FACS189427_13170 [Planctomycetales bacterium]|nr:hypothetical protein FACS189427_13170 [Planctomycetales bacterium]